LAGFRLAFDRRGDLGIGLAFFRLRGAFVMARRTAPGNPVLRNLSNCFAAVRPATTA
jgi:hypothetical protein